MPQFVESATDIRVVGGKLQIPFDPACKLAEFFVTEVFGDAGHDVELVAQQVALRGTKHVLALERGKLVTQFELALFVHVPGIVHIHRKVGFRQLAGSWRRFGEPLFEASSTSTERSVSANSPVPAPVW